MKNGTKYSVTCDSDFRKKTGHPQGREVPKNVMSESIGTKYSFKILTHLNYL